MQDKRSNTVFTLNKDSLTTTKYKKLNTHEIMNKTWFTSELLRLIKIKSKYFKLFQKGGISKQLNR